MLTNWRVQQWGLEHTMYQVDREGLSCLKKSGYFKAIFNNLNRGLKKILIGADTAQSGREKGEWATVTDCHKGSSVKYKKKEVHRTVETDC